MGALQWHNNWNEGWLARANVNLRGRQLTWWEGRNLERAEGVEANFETAGRWSLNLSSDVVGRIWSDDGSRSVAARNLTLNLGWRRLSWAQLGAGAGWGRTLDLTSGEPARFHTANLSSEGSVASIAYSLSGKSYELNRESTGERLIRARQLVAGGTWQLPRHVYVKVQSFVVRYDGSETEGVDKFLKALLGWQPNAFTGAYVGWSGQRRRDPASVLPNERMVERGLFAKVAYALQF